MSSNLLVKRKTIGVKLRDELVKELKILCATKDLKLYEVHEAALELLIELAKHGAIPDDLGYMLQSRNPGLLGKLERIVGKFTGKKESKQQMSLADILS